MEGAKQEKGLKPKVRFSALIFVGNSKMPAPVLSAKEPSSGRPWFQKRLMMLTGGGSARDMVKGRGTNNLGEIEFTVGYRVSD